MSRIKESLLIQEEKEYEMYIGYEEYLYENKILELKESDINEMEEELDNPSTVSNFIVSKTPLNNSNYKPHKGA